MAVERDEDVELVFDGNTRYVQVKTRQRPLILADLDSTLRRFAEIAEEHSSGRRRGPGGPALVVEFVEVDQGRVLDPPAIKPAVEDAARPGVGPVRRVWWARSTAVLGAALGQHHPGRRHRNP